MTIDRRTFVAAGAAAALVPGALRAQMRPEEAALYEAAKKEGQLTWYVAHLSSETAERVGKTFTARYPGVNVNVVRTTAQVAFQRLNQDLQTRVANCDVFASTDMAHCVDLKRRKLLLQYKPVRLAEIDKSFVGVDPDNYYHISSATFVSIIYNTNKVKAEDAPKSWKDLLDPKWANQVSVGHPGFSGFVGIWVVQMKKLYGWDYFEKLAKSKPHIGRSIIDVITTIGSGERLVGAGPGALAQLGASRGNPLGVIYPTEGSVLMVSPSAIMANTTRPNASKLFMEFLFGPEIAQISSDEYGTPLRPGVPLKPGVVPIASMKTIRPSTEEIMTGIPEVREQWRDTFGI